MQGTLKMCRRERDSKGWREGDTLEGERCDGRCDGEDGDRVEKKKRVQGQVDNEREIARERTERGRSPEREQIEGESPKERGSMQERDTHVRRVSPVGI